MQMNPAFLVITSFGGVRKTARMLDIDPSNVSRWVKRGTIPSSQQRKVLTIAWANNIDLTAHDIVMGRD
jgi:DNA-binding transcriptional regulator YdaS (Cro superfamily)